VGAHRPRNNCVGSANRIREDAPGRDPDYPEPVILDELKAALIVCGLLSQVVNDAFDLDNKLVLETAEIDHVWPNRMLTTEFQPCWSLPELLPEQPFGYAHVAAQ